MASFGENLRREREMRGVSLQEISSATKISVRLLQALEDEDFGQLPGGIFTRSFIRAFAKYLGLDEEQVMAEYHLAAPPESDLDLAHLTVNKPEARRAGAYAPAVALLLAAALLGGGYLLFRYARRNSEPSLSPAGPPPAAPVSRPVAPSRAAATHNRSLDGASLEKGTMAGPETGGTAGRAGPAFGTTRGGAPEVNPPALPQPDEGLVLQVAATERSWVAVDADHKTALQRVLGPGDVETVKAKESFDVTTGNALGIILTLNGETLKPMGRRGEVKSVHLTRSDARSVSP